MDRARWRRCSLKYVVWNLSLLCILALQPLPVLAQNAKSVVPWAGLTVGVGSYAMGDINALILSIDERYPEEFNGIHSGLALGVDVGLDFPELWQLAAHYRRLFAGSSMASQYGGPAVTTEFNLPADVVSASVAVSLSSRLHFGIAGGALFASGTYQVSNSSFGGGEIYLEGTSPYLETYLSLDLPVGPSAAIVPTLAYRNASVTVSELVDLSETEIDYEGVMLTVCLKVDFAARR
jgi:hypothetical protein